MSALDRIIARVEAGESPSSASFAKCWTGHGGGNAARACAGSLDAAKALHGALVPGWCVSDLSQDGTRAGNPWGCVIEDWDLAAAEHREKRRASSQYDYSAPARAWLLAILKAYRAKSEDAA